MNKGNRHIDDEVPHVTTLCKKLFPMSLHMATSAYCRMQPDSYTV